MPSIPVLPGMPPLAALDDVTLDVQLRKVPNTALLETEQIVKLAIGPLSLHVPTGTGLHPQFLLPIFEALEVSMNLAGIGCTHTYESIMRATHKIEEPVIWCGDDLRVATFLEQQAPASSLLSACKGQGSLLSIEAEVHRSESLRMAGNLARVWMRPNWDAFSMLLQMVPAPIPPYPPTSLPVDVRLRELFDRVYGANRNVNRNVIAAITSLTDILDEDSVLHTLVKKHAGETTVAAVIAALSGRRQPASTLLVDVHLAFMSVEDRLLTLVQGSQLPSSGDDTKVLRTVTEALEKDDFLRFLVDRSEWNLLPYGSWCDYLLNKGLREASKADSLDVFGWPQSAKYCDKERVLTLLAGKCTAPLGDVTVEITRRVDGLQSIVQGLIGGPLVTTVTMSLNDSVRQLRHSVAKAADLAQEGLCLLTMSGQKLDNLDKNLYEVAYEDLQVQQFPSQLVLQTSIDDVPRYLEIAIGKRIKLDLDMGLHLGVFVLPGIATVDQGRQAEMLVDCGMARVQSSPIAATRTHTCPGDQMFSLREERSVALSQKVDTLHSQFLQGDVCDDDGWLHDFVRVTTQGLHVSIVATLEGVLSSIDSDGSGEVSAQELLNSLHNHGLDVDSIHDADRDEDGMISLAEVAVWLEQHPHMKEVLAHSALLKEFKIDMQIGQCFLTAGMLCKRQFRRMPRLRIASALSAVTATIDLRDLQLVMAVATSVSDGSDRLLQELDGSFFQSAIFDGRIELKRRIELVVPGDASTAGTGFQIALGHLEPSGGSSFAGSFVPVNIHIARANEPVFSLESKWSVGNLRQLYGSTSIQADVQLVGMNENESRGAWEHWLEPWKISIVMDTIDASSTAPTDPPRLEVTSATAATLNVTHGLMRLGLELSSQLDSIFSKSDATQKAATFRRADLAFSPYILYNQTGFDIDFEIVNDTSQLDSCSCSSASMIALETGAHAWLHATQMRSCRPGMAQQPCNLSFRFCESSQNQNLCSVSIRELGVREVETLQPRKLFCHVAVDQAGRKAVTLRSAVQVQNQTDVDLTFEVDSKQFRLPAGGHWFVPISCKGKSARIRPCKPEGNEFSQLFSLSENWQKQIPRGPVKACLSDGTIFHCHATWRRETHSLLVLAFVPFLQITNKLPFAAQIMLTPSLQQRPAATAASISELSVYTVEPGGSFPLPCVGHWHKTIHNLIVVDCAVRAVDSLFPPVLQKLQSIYSQLAGDEELTRAELVKLWDKVEGTEEVIGQLMSQLGIGDLDAVGELDGDGSPRKSAQVLSKLIARGVMTPEKALKKVRAMQVADFLNLTSDDSSLDLDGFIKAFRFLPGTTNDVPEFVTVYHESLLQREAKSHEAPPPLLAAAWQQRDPQNAVPMAVPLARGDVPEGLLSMSYEISPGSGEPVQLQLYCSHWLVNNSPLPLVVQVHADAPGKIAELETVESFSKSLVSGVTGVFLDPIEGAKHGGALGLAKGVAHGVFGIAYKSVDASLALASGVVKHTVTRAVDSVALGIKGVNAAVSKETLQSGSLRITIHGLKFNRGTQAGTSAHVHVSLQLRGKEHQLHTPTIHADTTSFVSHCQTFDLPISEDEKLDLKIAVICKDTEGANQVIGADVLDFNAIRNINRHPSRKMFKLKAPGSTTESVAVELEVQWTLSGRAGPLSLAPATFSPQFAGTAVQTVGVRGYQLLGCGENDQVSFQFHLPTVEPLDGSSSCAAVGVVTADPDNEESRVSVKLSPQFGPVTMPLRVTVRAADPAFGRTKVVSISSTWVIANYTKRQLLVRASAGVYDVLKNTSSIPFVSKKSETKQVGTVVPLQFASGDQIEVLGVHKRGYGQDGAAVCVLSHAGEPHWIACQDGHQRLIRQRRRVVARFEVIVDQAAVYTSKKSKTEEFVHKGDRVNAFAIKSIKDDGKLLVLFERKDGQDGWVKLKTLRELYDPPIEHNSPAEAVPPGAIFDNVDGMKHSLGPGEQRSLDCWQSDTDEVHLRVAIASHSTVWTDGTQLYPSRGSDPIIQIYNHATASYERIVAHIPSPGVVELRDAVIPPYAIENETSLELEYLVTPQADCWWKPLHKSGQTDIWEVRTSDAAGGGNVCENDERTFDRVTLQLRAHAAAPFTCAFEHGEWNWEVSGYSLRIDVNPSEGGTMLVRIWTESQRQHATRSMRTEIRLHSINISVINNHSREVSRLALNNVRYSSQQLGIVHISILSAESEHDWSDCYCELSVLGEVRKTQAEEQVRGKVQWSEPHQPDAHTCTYQFSVGAQHESDVKLEVHSKQMLSTGSKVVGVATLPVASVAASEAGRFYTLPLMEPDSDTVTVLGKLKLVARFVACPAVQPQLFAASIGSCTLAGNLSLGNPPLRAKASFGPRITRRKSPALPPCPGYLIVTVESCTNLLAADSNGRSDPFLRLDLGGHSNSKQTRVKFKTLNPIFEESLQWELSGDEAAEQLQISVVALDYDVAGSNDRLGEVTVDVSRRFAAKAAAKQMENVWLHQPLEIDVDLEPPNTERKKHSPTKEKINRSYGSVQLVISFGRSAASATPSVSAIALPDGLTFRQKHSHMAETASLELDVPKCLVNVDSTLIRELENFAAELLPYVHDPEGVWHTAQLLSASAASDALLVTNTNADASCTYTIGPEVIRLKPTEVEIACGLRDYITNLDKDTSAFALARFAGFDLASLMKTNGMGMACEIVGVLTKVDLECKFDQLRLPAHGSRLTSDDSSKALANYCANQGQKVATELLPNPGHWFKMARSALAVTSGKTKAADSHTAHFHRGPRQFGNLLGELLPWDDLEDSEQGFAQPHSLLLISSKSEITQLVAQSVHEGVVPVLFDERYDIPAEILQRTRDSLLKRAGGSRQLDGLRNVAVMTTAAPTEVVVRSIAYPGARPVQYR